MRKGITSKGLISIMMINKVEICGVNTAKLPVLKEKEMKEFFEEACRLEIDFFDESYKNI